VSGEALAQVIGLAHGDQPVAILRGFPKEDADLTDGHISCETVMRPLWEGCTAGLVAASPARTRAVASVC